MMKVVFVYRYFYPVVGGTEKQALFLASSLVKRGIPARVITSRFEKSWPQREWVRGVEIVRLPSPRIKFLGALFFLLALSWYLFKIRNSFTILHTGQINYIHPFIIFLGWVLRKHTVLKVASSGARGDIRKWKGNPVGRICIGLAKRATAVIAMSDTILEELLSAGFPSSKIYMVRNGVDLSVYRKAERKEKTCQRLGLKVNAKTVIYTGRLTPEKGLDCIIQAFSRLELSLPLQLLIVGEGREKHVLMSLVQQLRLNDRVFFINGGYDIEEYLQVADLFILPSRQEGLSNSLLEAMACELPVISTRVSGSDELIRDGENGLLIDVDNEHQLIVAIKKVVGDPQLACELGKNARRTVAECCDLEKVTGDYRELYKKLESTRRYKS